MGHIGLSSNLILLLCNISECRVCLCCSFHFSLVTAYFFRFLATAVAVAAAAASSSSPSASFVIATAAAAGGGTDGGQTVSSVLFLIWLLFFYSLIENIILYIFVILFWLEINIHER